MGKGERPEHLAPPDIFYNEEEARKYTTNRLVLRGFVMRALPLPCSLQCDAYGTHRLAALK